MNRRNEEEMTQNVYAVSEHWGRGYSVEGVFLATPEQVAAAVGKTAYFGEICGKHSDVSLNIKPDTIKLVTDVPSEVDLIRRLGLERGENPIAALAEREGFEDDEEGR
jgi:hypothetical protein